MLQKVLKGVNNQCLTLLDRLYRAECGFIPLQATEAVTHTPDLIDRIGAGQAGLSHGGITPEILKMLRDQNLIEIRQDSDEGSSLRCWITPKGMISLQTYKEKELLEKKNITIDRDNIEIKLATMQDAQPMNLSYQKLDDFWSASRLHINGTLQGESGEVEVLAQVGVHVLDADTAYFQNDMKLGDLFTVNRFSEAFHEVLDNHYVDGESAHNMAELADMFGLPDSANRKIIMIERLLLNPLLIGRGVGKEILRRILLSYGQGGGIVIIPLLPAGAPLESLTHKSACKRLSQHYQGLGFENHPFVENVMVGDIDVCGMMMQADTHLHG